MTLKPGDVWETLRFAIKRALKKFSDKARARAPGLRDETLVNYADIPEITNVNNLRKRLCRRVANVTDRGQRVFSRDFRGRFLAAMWKGNIVNMYPIVDMESEVLFVSTL